MSQSTYQQETSQQAKEMLAYRDDIVNNLKKELELLNKLKDEGLFDNKHKGIFTNENYSEKISIIEEEIKKLEHFDVVLAVIGTMKAGKSTTINAIIGRELLPNRNRPMTTLPTLIYHTPNQSEPKLTFNNPKVNEFVQNLQHKLKQNPNWNNKDEFQTNEMKELIQKIRKGWVFQETYLGEEKIFEFLADLNDLVRLSEILSSQSEITFPFNECRNIDQLPKIEVAFRHLMDIPTNQGRLVLLDTPGPNEAGQTHLRTMLEEQLQRSSAVMLILDYTQLKSDASQEVKDQLDNIPTVSKERLFALINKFDEKNSNSDNEEATKQLILNDFLKDRIEENHIFPLSAQMAFVSNYMKTELDNTDKKPDWNITNNSEENWVNDFIKYAYGHAYELEEWIEEEVDDIRKKINSLIKKSKIQAPLQEAIINTQLEAPRIALQSALTKLDKSFKDINNFCETNLIALKKETGKEIENLENMLKKVGEHTKELSNLKENLEKNLNETRDNEKKQVEDKLNSVESKLTEQLNTDIDNFFKGINSELNGNTIKYWLKYMGEKEIQKFREQQNKIKHLKQANISTQSDEIAFDNNEEAEKIISTIHQAYDEQIEQAINMIKENINESIKKIDSTLSDTEKKTNDIFNKIEDEFKREKIQIELFRPKTKFDLLIESRNLSLTNMIKKKEIKTKIQSSGFLNWFKRLISDDWGYEEKTTRYFIIKKSDIQNMLKEKLATEFVKQTTQAIDDIFDKINETQIKDYFEKVNLQSNELIDEFKEQKILFNQNKTKKEKYRQIIENLLKQNKEIKEDIQIIQKSIQTTFLN